MQLDKSFTVFHWLLLLFHSPYHLNCGMGERRHCLMVVYSLSCRLCVVQAMKFGCNALKFKLYIQKFYTHLLAALLHCPSFSPRKFFPLVFYPRRSSIDAVCCLPASFMLSKGCQQKLGIVTSWKVQLWNSTLHSTNKLEQLVRKMKSEWKMCS